jgi:hypothetical protein
MPYKYGNGQVISCPSAYIMKAYPRFCYCGRWLVLPQKNKVQGDADQNAGE